jgi:hypothetical protein
MYKPGKQHLKPGQASGVMFDYVLCVGMIVLGVVLIMLLYLNFGPH